MSRDDTEVTEVQAEAASVTEQAPAGTEAPASTETPSEGTEPQAPETPATAQVEAKPEGPTEAEQKVAYDAFVAAAEEAVTHRDTTTGTIPEANVAPVKTAYVALPLPKNKAAARAHLEDKMKLALTGALDAPLAKAYMDLGAEVKATSHTRETVAKPPVDPTEEFVKLSTAHYLAVSVLTAGPDVKPEWPAMVQKLHKALMPEVQAWKSYEAEHAVWEAKAGTPDEATRGDEPKAPELHEVTQHAIKITQGRGTRSAGRPKKSTDGTSTPTTSTRVPYVGSKRSVKKHIQEAFASVPVGGFLKIGEIAKFQSTEYGTDRPSSGAVTAALESNKWDVANISKSNQGGVNGATKTA